VTDQVCFSQNQIKAAAFSRSCICKHHENINMWFYFKTVVQLTFLWDFFSFDDVLWAVLVYKPDFRSGASVVHSPGTGVWLMRRMTKIFTSHSSLVMHTNQVPQCRWHHSHSFRKSWLSLSRQFQCCFQN